MGMKVAIITGASSGMGKEFARRLAKEADLYGFSDIEKIWLIARSEDKLTELAEELGRNRFRIFALDLTKPEAITAFSLTLQEEKPEIRLLINCAGMGKSGAFATQSVKDGYDALSLNCTALTELTSVCLPSIIENGDRSEKKHGPRILNIASSAGFLPQPGFAVYAASKSYVINFSRALHRELADHNITVTCVCPGPCDTNFIKVSKNDPNATFTGFKSKFVTSVDKLIPASLKAASRGRSMLVFGFGQKCLHLASKLVPTDLILSIEKKLM